MALRGIKVVELAGLAPAPFCGMLLADFGATVIRVDRLGNSKLDVLGNGKKSIAIDLKQPAGKQIVKDLCSKSDVIIEPFRKGVMEKLQLGPDELMKINPKLTYARLTGFGQHGYYSERAGHDINYVAISGLLSLFARAGQNPTAPVNLAADFGGGGLLCALGIILALFERSRSGLGQVIDANMVEGTAYLGSWLYRSQQLPLWGQEAGENILDSGAHFYDTYRTKDGKYVAVGALEPQFYEQLMQGLGLGGEEIDQLSNFREKKEIVAKRFLEKTQDEWCTIFDQTDACVTPVLSLDEAVKHPHNAAKQSFYTNDEGIHCPTPAPTLSRTPGVSAARERQPECGEHTHEILTLLNYSKSTIAELETNCVIETYKKLSKL